MISTPIQKLVYGKVNLTEELFKMISVSVVRVLIIIISLLLML